MIDGTVGVPAAVRAVISVRVIGTVRTVVGVSTGTIAVVARVVPSPVVDIGVVVVDDGGIAPTTPIQSPSVPAPAPAAPAPACDHSPDGNAVSEVEANRSYRHRRRHVERHHHWRAV